MKTKILSIALLGLFSSSLSADYIVYPQGKDIKSIDVPKQSCLSNLSGLEDGMYTICGYNSGDLPVVNGEAFIVEPAIPLEGFSCSDGYANESQALILASMVMENIYTPRNSYKGIRGSGTRNGAEGRAYYKKPDGSQGASAMYGSSTNISGGSYVFNSVNPGTTETLRSPTNNAGITSAIYSPIESDIVQSEVANRACAVIPITE